MGGQVGHNCANANLDTKEEMAIGFNVEAPLAIYTWVTYVG